MNPLLRTALFVMTLTPLHPAQAQETYPAIIASAEEATLSTQMLGRIQTLNATLGATFAKGAVLVEFDCAEREAQLNATRADAMAARETHLAKLRLEGLGAAGELEVTTAAAAAAKAQAQVALIESQMSYCTIRAPFPGRVARLRAKAAETVNPGQALIEIVNPEVLKATINAPASALRSLQVGTRVGLRAPSGRRYEAEVSRINARIDGVSQTIEVEASVASAPGLVPGIVLEARFAPAQR